MGWSLQMGGIHEDRRCRLCLEILRLLSCSNSAVEATARQISTANLTAATGSLSLLFQGSRHISTPLIPPTRDTTPIYRGATLAVRQMIFLFGPIQDPRGRNGQNNSVGQWRSSPPNQSTHGKAHPAVARAYHLQARRPRVLHHSRPPTSPEAHQCTKT
jgi:hypothetical protein